MNARANKRRIVHRFFRRFLTCYPPDLVPLTEKDIDEINTDVAKLLPNGQVVLRRQLFV